MKRKNALAWIRIAGYHNDSTAFTRLYCENRISYPVAMAEFRTGAKMRANGIGCTCRDCQQQAVTA